LDRIDQSTAGTVVPVETVQVIARNQEGRNTFAALPHPDLGQVATAGKQVSPSEDVRGLKAGGFQK